MFNVLSTRRVNKSSVNISSLKKSAFKLRTVNFLELKVKKKSVLVSKIKISLVLCELSYIVNQTTYLPITNSLNLYQELFNQQTLLDDEWCKNYIILRNRNLVRQIFNMYCNINFSNLIHVTSYKDIELNHLDNHH